MKGTMLVDSGLYGIFHSNRKSDDHWGKNCFNSSFPTAMANYMMAEKIPAIYITLAKRDGKLVVIPKKILINEVFNCGNRASEELKFCFESTYEPYQKYAFETIDGIDLVVKDTKDAFLSPLEVKLTVLPTSNTCKLPEKDWGCELVIRSATTSYCAFGMFDSLGKKQSTIRDIFETSCSSIQSWDNDFEMSHKIGSLCDALDTFENDYLSKQKPILMQAIWKTQGQSPFLSENAFDIVVWSDFAFSRLFIDQARKDDPEKMSRSMRAAARLARCLWELSKSGKIHINDIYRQMAFGQQTDKEFAIQGNLWRKYVSDPRIITPILKKDCLYEIVEPERIESLRPERRFDQTLYFTMRGNR